MGFAARNDRGLVDHTAGGGFGTLCGPNVDTAGTATGGEGLIPGREYIASLDDGSGMKRVTIAVQIPDSFNTSAPCLVLGPSSGSRGVYGAIGTSGEWGLKHGCAVALVDAGKGVGLYDLSDDAVNKVDGTRATRTAAGALNFFATNITDAARTAYNAAFPNRLGLKQVHSQLNPEKDWGNDTLPAARCPLPAARCPLRAPRAERPLRQRRHAGESDTNGLIDSVVAAEPVTELPSATAYGIQFGGVAVGAYGKRLADFTTYGNLCQPCAALAAKGLVTGADTAARSLDALNKLRAYGWTTDNETTPCTTPTTAWATGRSCRRCTR